MLYLNLRIHSQVDVYIKVHLTVPNAGTVRICLYGAHWLYQPESKTCAFESNITLHYCRSSQFLPLLQCIFFSSQVCFKSIMYNLFFFNLLQVVVKFPWFEKQSAQAEVISLVR